MNWAASILKLNQNPPMKQGFFGDRPSLLSGTYMLPPLRLKTTKFGERYVQRLLQCALPINIRDANFKDFVSNEINEWGDIIKKKLQFKVDAKEISISAYDTAWVALIRDIHGSDAPQFPSCLDWIIHNQHLDGSWGDPHLFLSYDRLICTLACIIALKTWNVNSVGIERGICFIHNNIDKLKDGEPEHQLSGFELLFPCLIGMAHALNLHLLLNCGVLEDVYAKREEILKRIPREIFYNAPTTLLFSLEGIPNLDWNTIFKLQHKNGSFLCSVSSTAYAFIETGNENCFSYILDVVERFKEGVPHTYPVDLYERLWIVDRFDRLGFSRYFDFEIKECLDYVYKFWTPNGISWSRDTDVLDIDDTSMGFRILRFHGYDVKANTFKHFQKGDQFYCFVGQQTQGISEMLSLYRAAQLSFPGENILKKAMTFSFKVLKEKMDLGQTADRWVVSKGLVREVRYYMDVPWYASLPRIETRYYIDTYGADEDVWIAKVLYRMYNVSNNSYLEIAKFDYNRCQKLHQLEWIYIQRWYEECNMRNHGFHKAFLLKSYFLSMASIFEPERSIERLSWSQTSILIKMISDYFKRISIEKKKSFIKVFNTTLQHSEDSVSSSSETESGLVRVILKTLWDISFKVKEVHEKDVYNDLKHGWNTWLLSFTAEEKNHSVLNNEVELIALTLNVCAAQLSSIDLIYQPEYMDLMSLTSEICNILHEKGSLQVGMKGDLYETTIGYIELKMQELLQKVLYKGNQIAWKIQQTFLTIAKSYYYAAYFEPTTISMHIEKILFHRVE